MPNSLTVGVAWATEFARPGLDRLRYRRLRYAYRAPSFFAGSMLAGGCAVRFVRFDEELQLEHLDGTAGRLTDDVDLLYVATHGYCSSGYRVALRDADWAPCAGDFGASGPSVAVFDTCDLVNLNDPQWWQAWVSAAGRSLRLLLGFASPATVAHVSTQRGRAFAERILSGDAVARSWLRAVKDTVFPGLDVGIAVAFGDTAHDAEWALREMTLKDLPARRRGTSPVLATEVLP